MKIHSIVGLITNSSTELFVVDPTKFTVEQIEEKLELLYALLKRCNPVEISIAYEDTLETYGSSLGKERVYYQYNKGDILLSAEDSEWGYEALEVIESIFNAKRYHLG